MNKLNKIFKESKKIQIDDNTKIVIMSDCHRGVGDNCDNFLKNKNIFHAALNHYYDKGFIYIELGDGDDMWEIKKYEEIIDEHIDTFKLLKKFHDNNRLIMIYGNHDICKRNKKVLEKYFYNYYNKLEKKKKDLLKDLIVYEAIVLNYNDNEIFMIHGHQVDIFNGTTWFLARFLVRNIWHHLENLGIKDPTTRGMKNYKIISKTDKKLKRWSKKNGKIIIAGHTHRSVFPKNFDSLYFNDGCCIHPNGISCLEIENGYITLVKWEFKLNKDNLLSVERIVVEEKISIFNLLTLLKNRQ